ncbi:MAG: hypothetical protein NTW76_21705 [Corynebacteriales bacterium]|uniref:DUF5134 domain-containing protein n=1 Tax=Williamsia herbipolensis TaxID=1603258 RepID=A0AAU4JZ55_9NOCA|nr:hypothetical protein [Williamsia herbipolensis]MCX6471908.1 hypothetical protein [Mycobacteriales bacterium]
MLLTMPMAIGVHLMTIAMSVGCLWCGIRLTHNPRVREWAMSAAMAAAMIAAHLAVTGPHHSHHPMAPDMTESAGGSTAMTAALGLALTELIMAVAVIWILTPEPTTTTEVVQRLPRSAAPVPHSVVDSATPLIARENTRP